MKSLNGAKMMQQPGMMASGNQGFQNNRQQFAQQNMGGQMDMAMNGRPQQYSQYGNLE